jgi:hypothetical protein
MWLILAILSFILQFFLTTTTAYSSIWEYSVGWQREIGLWYLGIAVTIIISLISNKKDIMKFLTLSLLIISIIFGTYHLMSIILTGIFGLFNLFMMFFHYLAVAIGIYLSYVDKKKNY